MKRQIKLYVILKEQLQIQTEHTVDIDWVLMATITIIITQ